MKRRWSDFCECDSIAGIVLKGFFKHRMEIRPASMRDKWRCITTSSTINTISSHNTADPSLSQTFHFPYQSASSWLVTFHPLLPPNICAIAPFPSTETLHKWNPHLWSQMQKKLINTSVSSRLDYCNALLAGKCPSKAQRQGCQAADEGAGGGDKKPLHLSFTHFAGFLSMFRVQYKISSSTSSLH